MTFPFISYVTEVGFIIMTKYDSFMKYQVIKDDNWEKNRAKQIQSYNTEKT
ncbi:hypothetical protein PRUB_a2787 [Pseudoalteromonas rubra]|uniref:Uncharacterized protein n=1 Tax=Pseudoalteromonas rubra TaxID=43658 RepID=A0A8T0CBW8_9GAMM|nr:hypothetical protein PRUB_a2787 [Pseudoalteromonas rubra]